MRERLLRLEVNVRELARFRQTYTREDVRREPHLEMGVAVWTAGSHSDSH